jgi:hypothetical protein
MRFRLVLATCLLAAAARASNVTDELAINSTQATDANPRSGYVSDSLNASFDLAEKWSLNAGATLTLVGQTPAAARGQFGSSGSAISAFNGGLDWDASDNWSLGASFDFSPRATQFVGTQVQLSTSGTQGNALMRSQTSSYDGSLDLSYDTAGDSNLELSFSGAVTGSHLEADQAITRVRTSTGAAATAQQIRDYCATHKCPRGLVAALRPQTGITLDSQKFSLAGTVTLSKDTDLTLSGDYYHYQQDPTEVGYFSVAAVGGHFGSGVPIAPLQFMIRPEAAHRFGAFSVKLWVQLGKYVEGGGDSTKGIGLKLQYKFTKAFRTWVTISGQSDIGIQCAPLNPGQQPDPSGQCIPGVGGQTYVPGGTTNSGGFSMGAGYRF